MNTKTKVTTNRGRPKKDFSTIEIKTNKTGTRGRPKKEEIKGKKIEKTLNAKIIDYGKEVNKLSNTNKNIHLDIQNSTFVSRKIDQKNSKKSDNFALWLLIVSMLLFIFSLYKTFYINKNIEDYNYNKIYQENNIVDIEKNTEWEIRIERQEIVLEEEQKTIVFQDDIEIIKNFYDKINQKDFDALINLVDSHLKSSNVFRTYYNKNRLSKFIENTINKKIYAGNIEKIEDGNNINSDKYWFNIKYKLNNNNELFKEDREIVIVKRWDQKLIGSIRCITTWCSKMPFFNPQRYGIK